MSDHWEFFPCQMGQHVAFIFYDHGIRETIDSFAENQQVRFELRFKQPNENGLPTDDEYDAATGIEDEIERFTTANGGMYVGRVTTAGHRYFYTFQSGSAGQLDAFIESLLGLTGYKLRFRVQEDPEKSGYWTDLYPTADDWQMIQDSKVVNALQESGDNNDISRRIDHWVFFKAKSDARSFVAWLEGEGFSLQEMKRTNPLTGKWKVQFYRSDSPELYTINGITFKLRHKAAELAGTYDGWETSVERS